MKKVLIAILSIYYLFIFILCLESLISIGIARNFGMLWLLPSIAALLLHAVFCSKKLIRLNSGLVSQFVMFYFLYHHF